MESNHTTHLSTYEYLQVLQLEYVVTELRKKVYIKRKDREFFKRVLVGKEKKIKDICLRNSLPSLFEDEDTKRRCYQEVYGEFGYPNFHYKNHEQVEEFRVKDFYYYYSKDSDFKVKFNDGIKIGILHSVDEANKVANIKVKGEEEIKPFSLENIARII